MRGPGYGGVRGPGYGLSLYLFVALLLQVAMIHLDEFYRNPTSVVKYAEYGSNLCTIHVPTNILALPLSESMKVKLIICVCVCTHVKRWVVLTEVGWGFTKCVI